MAGMMSFLHANGAAYTDVVSVCATLGPRCPGGYFGSRLNFEVDQ